MRRAAPWFALAAAVIAVDQLTKWAALAALTPGVPVKQTGFFNLTLTFNPGVAFSLLRWLPPWSLVAFNFVAAGVVSWLLLRSPGRRLQSAALALILAGALGNAIDRMRFGKVVDFIDFHLYGLWPWVFNVADSGITIGAVLLILDSLLNRPSADARHA